MCAKQEVSEPTGQSVLYVGVDATAKIYSCVWLPIASEPQGWSRVHSGGPVDRAADSFMRGSSTATWNLVVEWDLN